jgi:hypothetical protein
VRWDGAGAVGGSVTDARTLAGNDVTNEQQRAAKATRVLQRVIFDIRFLINIGALLNLF